MNETIESLIDELNFVKSHYRTMYLFGDDLDRKTYLDSLHDVKTRIRKFRANNAKD